MESYRQAGTGEPLWPQAAVFLTGIALVVPRPSTFSSLVTDMDRTGRVDRAYKSLKVARDREVYEARKEAGRTVADLEALAASGYRAAVILADPPWLFETWGERGKIWTSVDNHYDPMTLDAIKALPVASLAADDCALFLWATWPFLPQALDVITAWGFTYKTCAFNWIKTNPSGQGLHWGNGYATRSNSEVCLLATRGALHRMEKDVHQASRSSQRKA